MSTVRHKGRKEKLHEKCKRSRMFSLVFQLVYDIGYGRVFVNKSKLDRMRVKLHF